MSMLAVHNPATGEPIAELLADDATTVADKARRARAAQPAWAALPLAERMACIERFRAGLLAELDGLAATMTAETGKPIAMSRNELNGLVQRIDFFLAEIGPATAAAALADGAMHNTGQSCCAVERIYVHEAIHDAFVAAFLDTVAGFRIGDPMDDATTIGPLTRAPQLDVLQAQVTDAVAKGATLLTGGHRIDRPGHWFEPTVLTHVNHTMALMQEESFGPVIGIQKVSGDDEAIALMNDSRYGLTAGVFTPDADRARRLLSQLKAGSVYWNCCDRVSPRLPWSGVGDSGVGLTLSTYGIQAFTRVRAWHLRQGWWAGLGDGKSRGLGGAVTNLFELG